MKVKVPHTYVLLLGLIALATVSTWFVPAGKYELVERLGRATIDPDSYHSVPAHPAGIADVFLSFPKGLIEVADIVFYIFIIGGAFGVLNGTGAIEAGISLIVRKIGNRGDLIVPILTLVFAIGGGTIGIAEETLVFLPVLLLLARSLGYDSLVAGGIALVGANAGFASAFMNPFTVGVAQGIAGLPIFSGIAYRAAVWTVVTTATILFLSYYASRIKKNPSLSPMYHLDQSREPVASADRGGEFTGRHMAVLLISTLAIGALAVGAFRWHWGILQLSALFFALSIAAGLVGRISLDEAAGSFVKGASEITYAALVVGLARGILVILREASVIDTITHAMATTVEQWPSSLSVIGIYAMQNLLNFVVPSGSGQAAVSMPILAPLGDLLGITRQTNVLAYQLGNGFTNILTPTQGYFMAALGILQIPWSIWVRWLFPLLAIWLILGAVALLFAQSFQWGPF